MFNVAMIAKGKKCFIDRNLKCTGICRIQTLEKMNSLIVLSLSVIWNWEALESFKPARELRQGDPQSLYLFVLCIKILGHMIKKSVDKGDWKGTISHLFFANDLLLFSDFGAQ